MTVTNTFEVAKTRLQLDGELRPKGEPRMYKNVFDALGKTYATEGIRGIQRGLGAAVRVAVSPLMHNRLTRVGCSRSTSTK